MADTWHDPEAIWVMAAPLTPTDQVPADIVEWQYESPEGAPSGDMRWNTATAGDGYAIKLVSVGSTEPVGPGQVGLTRPDFPAAHATLVGNGSQLIPPPEEVHSLWVRYRGWVTGTNPAFDSQGLEIILTPNHLSVDRDQLHVLVSPDADGSPVYAEEVLIPVWIEGDPQLGETYRPQSTIAELRDAAANFQLTAYFKLFPHGLSHQYDQTWHIDLFELWWNPVFGDRPDPVPVPTLVVAALAADLLDAGARFE